jgi:DNA-binding transcriptional MerR regulator
MLTIGKVAAAAGLSRDAVRYYERLGLIPRPARSPAGYRCFGDGVIRRLTLIRNAQRFGFSLREICGFLRVRDAGGKPCYEVRAAAQRLLEAVDRQIETLTAARHEMARTLSDWDAALASTPARQTAHLLERLPLQNGMAVRTGRLAPHR